MRHSGILSNAGHEESCANLPGLRHVPAAALDVIKRVAMPA